MTKEVRLLLCSEEATEKELKELAEMLQRIALDQLSAPFEYSTNIEVYREEDSL